MGTELKDKRASFLPLIIRVHPSSSVVEPALGYSPLSGHSADEW
jgi:hypothetical protein